MFTVKRYSKDERPIIKGHGFDGLEIGEDRQEAQEFVDFINQLLETAHNNKYTAPQATPKSCQGCKFLDIHNKICITCTDFSMFTAK